MNENTEEKHFWTTGKVILIGLILMFLALFIFGGGEMVEVEYVDVFWPSPFVSAVVIVAISICVCLIERELRKEELKNA